MSGREEYSDEHQTIERCQDASAALERCCHGNDNLAGMHILQTERKVTVHEVVCYGDSLESESR